MCVPKDALVAWASYVTVRPEHLVLVRVVGKQSSLNLERTIFRAWWNHFAGQVHCPIDAWIDLELWSAPPESARQKGTGAFV